MYHVVLSSRMSAKLTQRHLHRLLPIFVPSRTALHADIPITPVGKDGRRDDVGDDPVWKAKSGKLYWVCIALKRYCEVSLTE
jgi:beta-1,2-xylosyltransferase